MKTKYVDKRGWKRAISSTYKEVKMTLDNDSWIVGMLTVDKVRNPLHVNILDQKVCVLDNGFKWMTLLPENQKFSMTVMYNTKLEVMQYYFDINEKNIAELGEARRKDLYLDVLVLPDGRCELVDEDDLERALSNGRIDKKKYKETKHVAEQLKLDIEKHFDSYQKIANACLDEIMTMKHLHKA